MDTSATGKFQRESRCQICICSSADPLFRYAGLKPPLKHLQIPFHLLTVKQYSGFRAECGMLPPLQFFEGAAIFWRIQLRFWKLFCFKFYIYIHIFNVWFLQVVGWNMYKAAKDFRNSAEFFKWPYFLVLLQVLLPGWTGKSWSAPMISTDDRHQYRRSAPKWLCSCLFSSLRFFFFLVWKLIPKCSLEKLSLN